MRQCAGWFTRALPVRSLFVLSLPRSLSTEVHAICGARLGLQSPSWTSAGEILNLDRFALQGVLNASFPKYITRRHGAIYGSTTQFLDHAFVEDGFCYKDVVQPFVVSAWLKQGPPRQALKIKPNIAHVAFAMLQRRWLYPTVASRQIGTTPAMMVEGLLMAEAALSEVPGEEVAFDDLLSGFAPLDAALAHFDKGGKRSPVIVPHDFERRRDEVLARRGLDLYKHLSDLEAETRARMAQDAADAVERPAHRGAQAA